MRGLLLSLGLSFVALVSCSGGASSGARGDSGTNGTAASSGVANAGGANAAGGSATGGGSTGTELTRCPAGPGRLLDDLEREDYWGFWYTFNDASQGGVQTPTAPFLPEQDEERRSQVAHTTGSGFTQWGAGIGLSLSGVRGCYDLGRSGGLSLAARGPANLRVTATLPGALPLADGGTCDPAAGDCYDVHGYDLAIAAGWNDYQLSWDKLRQAGWGVPVTFQPFAILSVQFSVSAGASFDYAIDDVHLLDGEYLPPGDTGGSTGAAGAPTTGGSQGAAGSPPVVEGTFGEAVSAEQFHQMFPDRNSFYSYDGLLQATTKFPIFAGQGELATRKREAAAFLGNVARETGDLRFVEEIAKPHAYCDTGPFAAAWPCAAGKSYYGRGPIQLSWNYNYGAAGDYLKLNLLANPDLVGTSPSVAWQTGLWFWTTSKPQGSSCHDVISTGQGFGATIRIINGPQECGGAWPEAVQQRVEAYQRFCQILGVEPGSGQSC